MTDSIATLGFRADTGALDRANNRLSSLSDTGRRTDSTMATLTKTIGTVAAAVASMAVANRTIQSHIEFTSAISQLSAITGAAGKQLEFYKEQSLAIGSATTLSATQAAQAFKLIASAKPDLLGSADALAQVTKEAVTLAEAAGIDLPTAAQALGSSLNQFQLGAGKASEVINVLAASSKLGTASVQMINESLVNAGSAANALGIDLVDTVAGIQALAKAGIVGSEGGTAFRQVLLKLEKTANEDLMPSIVGVTSAIEKLSSMNLSTTELMKLFGEEAFKSAAALLAQKDTLIDLSSSLRGTSVAYEQARINQNNLGGDLKKLNSIIETIALSAGENLDGSLRSVTQSTSDLLGNIDALADAGIALSSVVGVGLAGSLAKSTIATVSQTAADLAAINAARASAIARATIGASATRSATMIAASEFEMAAARVENTVFTVAQLDAEMLLERNRLASQISQTGRMASVARMAEIQTAKLLITNQLTAAEARLGTASAMAARAEASQTAATLALASAEATATASTTALGAAIRFMLGPWGLLITAVGVAAAVFLSAKDDSDELERSLGDQKTAVNELEQAYKGNTAAQLTNSLVKSNKINLELLYERYAIEKKLNAFGSAATMAPEFRAGLVSDLADVNAMIGKTGASADAARNILQQMAQDGVDSIKWTDGLVAPKEVIVEISEEYQKWLDKVNGFQTPMQKLVAELEKVKSAGLTSGGAIEYMKDLQAAIDSLNSKAEDTSYQDWLDSVTDMTRTGKLILLQEEFRKTGIAMMMGDLDSSIAKERMKDILDEMKDLKDDLDDLNLFGGISGSIADSLTALKGFTSEGSREFAALGVAADAFNAIQAIGAVINQASSGDPYSAFPRMAAMIGAMASLGQSISGAMGGGGDSLKDMQATQGLNIWGAKSESIAAAIEITASATDKLVGINSGMLVALKSMQAGISGVAGITAQSFLETGIAIAGGSISETETAAQITPLSPGDSAISHLPVVEAFYAEGLEYESTQASEQVGLVFESLIDAVVAGGSSLGIGTSELEKRIAEFNLAATSISLKDLDADQQQKEIEAVFGRIFDDLALSVVPFIDKFRVVGEGYGETLSRVSTEVAIAEYAVKNLGVELTDKLANPELFATIADNLATLTGGVELFADKVLSFVDDFAPETVKFTMYSDAIKESLASVGLSVPASADAFYALMTTLDGTTEAGQNQIAALLNAQDTANGYYDLLEDRQDKEKSAREAAQSELDSFNTSLMSLSKTLRSAVVSIYGSDVQTSNIALDAALQAAKIGDFSKALALDLSNVNPQIADFTSLESFNVEQAKTANKLASIADLTAQTATVDEMALTAAQEQVTLLGSINERISSAYAPAETVTENNGKMISELSLMRADIEKIKYASESTAKNAAKSANIDQRIELDGLDVRVVA